MPKSERNPKRKESESPPEMAPSDVVYKIKGRQTARSERSVNYEIGSCHLLQDDDQHGQPVFDLGERTALFGEEIIRFAKKIPRNPVNNRLISQCVGSGTSVSANYCEADDAISRKEFKKYIGTCRKESKETKHWLRMIAIAEPSLKEEARQLWREAKELNLIFGSIFRKP